MFVILLSPFFLLFSLTSGLAAYLGQRVCARDAKPTDADRWLAIVTAFLSVALSAVSYCIRRGSYCPAHIDATVACVVAAVTGLGVAFVCLQCVLGASEATE